MSRVDPTRWLPVAVLIAVCAAGPQGAHPQSRAPAIRPAPLSATPPTPQTTNRTAPPQPQPAPINLTPAQPPPTPEQFGDALMMHQRYQEAIESYKQIRHPSAAVWNKMGIAYQMLLNLNEASRCYRMSLKLDSHNAQVLNNLGTIYDLLKQPRSAEHMYRQALKFDPQSAITYKNLGTNLLGQQKYEKGWDAYKKALAIDPNVFQNTVNPRVQDATSLRERGALNYYMARGCAHAGQVDCAIEYLRMALIEGYTTPKKLKADAEFSNLLATQAFQQLIADQSNPSKQPRTETVSAPAPQPPLSPDQPKVGR